MTTKEKKETNKERKKQKETKTKRKQARKTQRKEERKNMKMEERQKERKRNKEKRKRKKERKKEKKRKNKENPIFAWPHPQIFRKPALVCAAFLSKCSLTNTKPKLCMVHGATYISILASSCKVDSS